VDLVAKLPRLVSVFHRQLEISVEGVDESVHHFTFVVRQTVIAEPYAGSHLDDHPLLEPVERTEEVEGGAWDFHRGRERRRNPTADIELGAGEQRRHVLA